MYALVDCNSFFASCERVFRPDLKHTPIVVLSNNDGCVVAQTNEVKALNIPAFVAYFKVKPVLDQHKVIAFSSNYELYADLSMRVMNTLAPFGRDISIYSIDEAFLDVTGDRNLIRTGKMIKHTVMQHVGLPVCVGMGNTKTLAKLANHIAKKSNKCDGVCEIHHIASWENVLKKIAVGKVWGIGRQTSKRLADLNIHSVHDFMHTNPNYLRQQFNVNIERTWKELHGERCIAFHDDIASPKQIYRTRSFGNKTHSKEALHASLTHHTHNALKKARQHNLLVATVLIFIQTSRYAKQPYSNHALLNLDTPTADTRRVLNAVSDLLDRIYKPHYDYYKTGVGLIQLVSAENHQQDVFSEHDSLKSHELMRLIDQSALNGMPLGFGRSIATDTQWQMKRGSKSPRYTTRFDELPIVKLN